MTERQPTSFLIVSQYYPPERGAAQVRLGSVARVLHRRGHRVEVLTAIPNYPLGRFFDGWSTRPLQRRDEDGVRVTRVWVWAAMGSGLGRMANYLSFAVTSALGLLATRRSRWMFVEYPVLLAKVRRQPLVVNVADLWVDAVVSLGGLSDGRLAKVLLVVERWMLRQADVVTAVTYGMRDAIIEKGVDPSRVAWLPNGADTELFSPGEPDLAERRAIGLGDHEHLILYAGTHGYVHGLEVVLDAAELLADQPVRFLLVGGGSERDRLVADAAARGIDNVVFWEPVEPERIAALLRIATIGLACTREGDLYRSIRSAKVWPVMSSATPIIYSGDDESALLVADAGAGLHTPAGDAPALAEAIRGLLDDPDRAAALGAQGRQYVIDEASWEAIVDRWLDDLDRIAAEHGVDAT
jgi:colanic acid biosynthesis glycosyl transferase WcaI